MIVENKVHARNIFNMKYEKNIVKWSGYYVESKQPRQVSWLGSNHQLNVLIKMSPTESTMYPDLVLSLSTKFVEENRELVKSLQKGD